MGENTLTSRELVEGIWHEVAVDKELQVKPAFGPAPEFASLVHDEERHYINAQCDLETSLAIPPAGGRFSKLKDRLKRRSAQFVALTLERYFVDERDFLSHLVRFQNNISVNHDRVASEVRRLHRQVELECRRLYDRDAVLHELLEKRIEALEHELARLKGTGTAPA